MDVIRPGFTLTTIVPIALTCTISIEDEGCEVLFLLRPRALLFALFGPCCASLEPFFVGLLLVVEVAARVSENLHSTQIPTNSFAANSCQALGFRCCSSVCDPAGVRVNGQRDAPAAHACRVDG